MKCKICKAEAVVALRSHNAAFCPDCYKTFFSRQVARGIEGQKLFTRDERVLVALSGGKDSLALMLELSLQGYNVRACTLTLAFPFLPRPHAAWWSAFAPSTASPLWSRTWSPKACPFRLSKNA